MTSNSDFYIGSHILGLLLYTLSNIFTKFFCTVFVLCLKGSICTCMPLTSTRTLHPSFEKSGYGPEHAEQAGEGGGGTTGLLNKGGGSNRLPGLVTEQQAVEFPQVLTSIYS